MAVWARVSHPPPGHTALHRLRMSWRCCFSTGCIRCGCCALVEVIVMNRGTLCNRVAAWGLVVLLLLLPVMWSIILRSECSQWVENFLFLFHVSCLSAPLPQAVSSSTCLPERLASNPPSDPQASIRMGSTSHTEFHTRFRTPCPQSPAFVPYRHIVSLCLGRAGCGTSCSFGSWHDCWHTSCFPLPGPRPHISHASLQQRPHHISTAAEPETHHQI